MANFTGTGGADSLTGDVTDDNLLGYGDNDTLTDTAGGNNHFWGGDGNF